MNIPEHVDPRWIATLGDDQLLAVEADLHAVFRAKETAEKTRMGRRYVLLQGPPALVQAWHRWVMVSDATRTRGLVVYHPGEPRVL